MRVGQQEQLALQQKNINHVQQDQTPLEKTYSDKKLQLFIGIIIIAFHGNSL